MIRVLQGQTSSLQLTFTYDNTGHITTICDTTGQTWTYSYSTTVYNATTRYRLKGVSVTDTQTSQMLTLAAYTYYDDGPWRGYLRSSPTQSVVAPAA